MKIKGLTSVLLIMCIALSLLSIVFAAGLQTTNKRLHELQALIEGNNRSIRSVELQNSSEHYEYRKAKVQAALYNKQAALYSYSSGLHSKKKEHETALEKYRFQAEYYNVCLLIKNLTVLNSELELVTEQLEAEQEKLDLGHSTELAVKELQGIKRSLEDAIAKTNNTIATTKNSLKSRLSIGLNESFSPQFELPTTITNVKSYTVNALTTAVLSNNLELNTISNSITAQLILIRDFEAVLNINDNELLLARADFAKMQLEDEALRSRLELYVRQKHYEYTEAYSSINTQLQRKQVLQEKLVVLEQEYSEGVHSELEYKAAKLSIDKQLYEVEVSMVNYLNAGVILDLVNSGIWVK